VPPIRLLRPSCRPWEGALTLAGVIARLRDVLPPTFEDLQRPFAVSGATFKRTPVKRVSVACLGLCTSTQCCIGELDILEVI